MVSMVLAATFLISTTGFTWAASPAPLMRGTTASYPPHPITSIIYTNLKYHFQFTLPASWKGFSVISSKWKGYGITPANQSQLVEAGPFLSMRNPLWKAKHPYQDIPIYIFTIKQWNELKKNVFSVGAAPIPPSELGRNKNYVFALPARYNFAFPAGYQEVIKILANKPLHAY